MDRSLVDGWYFLFVMYIIRFYFFVVCIDIVVVIEMFEEFFIVFVFRGIYLV